MIQLLLETLEVPYSHLDLDFHSVRVVHLVQDSLAIRPALKVHWLRLPQADHENLAGLAFRVVQVDLADFHADQSIQCRQMGPTGRSCRSSQVVQVGRVDPASRVLLATQHNTVTATCQSTSFLFPKNCYRLELRSQFSQINTICELLQDGPTASIWRHQ